MTAPVPPFWLVSAAVSAVWLYEGLWCKLLRGDPNQFRIVATVPRLSPGAGLLLLRAIGGVEIGLALWALSGIAPFTCALAQTLLLVTMNAGGLLWARPLIHDPGGMVVKNFAFLVLVWVAAGLSGRP